MASADNRPAPGGRATFIGGCFDTNRDYIELADENIYLLRIFHTREDR